MGKINERCGGIDIGKRFLFCCALTGAAHEEPCSQIKRFDVTVPGLTRLRDWLDEQREPRSNGEYRIVLDSCIQHIGRPFRSGAGQSRRG
jgi:hypothetical protein